MREREIEALRDHLARLLEQADQLLHEWQTFGEDVRATLDAQVRTLDAQLGRAVAEATRTLAPKVAAELSRELSQTIELLRRDIQGLREAARRATADLEGPRRSARGGEIVRWLPLFAVGLALVANVLLAMLLLRSPTTTPPTTLPAALPVHAAVSVDAAAAPADALLAVPAPSVPPAVHPPATSPPPAAPAPARARKR